MAKKIIIIRDDPNYNSRRNECIGASEEYANFRNGVVYGIYNKYKAEEEWRAAWNKDFHSKMDELVKSGLRRRRMMDEED